MAYDLITPAWEAAERDVPLEDLRRSHAELLAALCVFVELHERGAWPGTEDIAAGRAAIAKAAEVEHGLL